MEISRRMRLVFVMCILAFSFIDGLTQVNLEVRDLMNGYQLKAETIGVALTPHEIAGLEFSAFYANTSSDTPYSIRLTVKSEYGSQYKIPDYVEGWQEKSQILAPGESIILKNEVLIRPVQFNSIREDSFYVEAWLRRGSSPYSELIIARAKIYTTVYPPKYDYPTVLKEPSYSPGFSNTVQWLPVRGSVVQEVYYFDKENPSVRLKAIRRIYKSSGNDTFQTTIQNLQDGHTYGYFVKAVFDKDGKSIPIYSDFVYSTQDAFPPGKVESTQAVVRNYGVVLVTWKKASDALSGIARYRIYKAIDTGSDRLVDSVEVTSGQGDFLTWQDQIDSVSIYHYRVTAVDAAGNEGEGVPSNDISMKSQKAVPPVPSNPPGGESVQPVYNVPFIRGTTDTLRILIHGKENFIRFQSVRDSLYYFSSPPVDGMRVFDSGWLPLDSIPPDPANARNGIWLFDYTRNGTVDGNFVNGHTYHRRVVRKILAVNDTVSLGAVRPDCFPPDDIHNLKAQELIVDPEPSEGYTRWRIRLQWDPAIDASSGVKGYRIYRKIDTRDSVFQEIPLTDLLSSTQYDDSVNVIQDTDVNNPMVFYRVFAEDGIGNVRPLDQTVWTVSGRALGKPVWDFDPLSPESYPTGQDTLFTRKDSVALFIRHFDVAPVNRYLVEINGTEFVYENPGSNRLVIRLPDVEVAKIRIRALYLGGISSVWTGTRWAVRILNRPVQNVTAWNDTAYWGGNIYLKWARPSLDVKQYAIWRYRQNKDSVLVGYTSSKADTVVWTDYYDVDERNGKKGDPLSAYEMLNYRIHKINLFDENSSFSKPASAFSNRPPHIVSSSIKAENNRVVIQIRWRRPYPNSIRNNFTTLVRIFQDGFDQPVALDVVADDDSSYTYRNALPGRNYIFQIREILNDDALHRKSSWSQPYTKSLREIRMDVQPQPKGSVFIVWDRSAVDTLRIHTFLLQRVAGKDTVQWVYSNNPFSKMDSSSSLIHGQAYQYSLFALDSLDQVIALGVKTDTCDTGAAYIPAVVPFTMRYFRTNTLDVSWEWKTVSGRSISKSTRGAKTCLLQISVSKNFPTDTSQTRTIGPFAADPEKKTLRVTIPWLGNRENDRMYFRITANDAWGHPVQPLWSTDFYGLVQAAFDSIAPKVVADFSVVGSKSYYKRVNYISAILNWTSVGIDQTGVLDPLATNVDRYRIVRQQNNAETILADVLTRPGTSQYSIEDTLSNAPAKWKIVSIDSAGNSASSGWKEIPVIVPTPLPPKPVKTRECTVQPISPASGKAEYYVEIAMRPDHFRLAYEMDPKSISNRLICGSGWFAGSQYACTTGWGTIETDTTYFRVKARTGVWESGWSETVTYKKVVEYPGHGQQEGTAALPTEFGISQNYPNPFNAETRMDIQMPEGGSVDIQIFSITGRRIRNLVQEVKPSGRHSVVWDGKEENGDPVSSGIFIALASIRSETGVVFQKRIKMMVLK